MFVIAGSASRKLALRVARLLGCKLIKPEFKRFPDGENYIRIKKNIKDEHVVVVQSIHYPQNDNLVEFLLLLDAAKDLGAKRVTAVTPYLAYARQDKRFKPGEAVSIHTVAKLIECAGADELIAVDLHHPAIKRNFSIPVQELTAAPLIGRHFSYLKVDSPLVLAPDDGAFERARQAASELGADSDYLEKKRITPTRVVTRPKSLDAAGRNVVIIDDIISTGGTLVEAIKILKKSHAHRIYVACTHPVLVGNALKRILKAGARKVVATDTIETKVSTISVAPLIADAIRARV
jgi:ribose-phosphate pyrophosphokinase